MLNYGSKIFHRNNHVKFIFNINLIELISFHSNGSLEWFLQDSCDMISLEVNGNDHYHTFVAHSLFAEACEVYMIAIRIDVDEVDAGAEMLHQLPQSPR